MALRYLKKKSSENAQVANDFQTTHGYSWDVVMVFPKDPDSTVKKVEAQLNRNQLETGRFLSVQEDEAYLAIRCTPDVLGKYANLLNYELPLNEQKAKMLAKKGSSVIKGFELPLNEQKAKMLAKKGSSGIKGFEILEPDEEATEYGKTKVSTSRRPFTHLYGKYEKALDDVYERAEGLAHPFSTVHRIKILSAIIESKALCNVDCTGMLAKKHMLAYFPLHNPEQRELLQKAWIPGGWKIRLTYKQPFDQIKNYFGEKIGMYFAFFGHYTTWLFWLGLVGLIFFILSLCLGTLSNFGTVSFAAFTAFWSVFLVEFWKRREATLAMEWGMAKFEKLELERPEFVGDKRIDPNGMRPGQRPSPITGKPSLYFPSREARKRIYTSLLVVASMIGAVIAAVAFVYFLQFNLSNSSHTFVSENAVYIGSGLMSVQINIFNVIYGWVSVWLNNWENHRTNTTYEDSLIYKTLIFQFINSYVSLFYTAFVKRPFFGCTYGTYCMNDLASSLSIIFIMNILLIKVMGMVSSFLAARRKAAELKGTIGKDLSVPEQEYILEPVDTMMGILTQYASLTVQFGYVTLFVTAFPLTPLLAWLQNYIDLGADAESLLLRSQRAFPRGAQDIGTWLTIFRYLGNISVVTNAAVITFTSGILEQNGWTILARVWFFILSQYTMMLVMQCFAVVVEDVPDDVRIQGERCDYIVSKIIERVPDDEEDLEETKVADPPV